MKLHRVLTVVLFMFGAFLPSTYVMAGTSADATLELTFTLTAVTITDSLTGNSTPAIFETSNEVGDLIFEDFGPNGSTAGGGAPTNPPGSVGSNSASEQILLNGLDPFEDDYDLDSFGIGDSFVTTMTTSATAETPGSTFFAQVNSFNTLFFSVFGDETDSYTFSFDYSLELTGLLDSSSMPGVTLAFGEGLEVNALADSTLAGPPNSFLILSNYFNLGEFNSENAVVPVNEILSDNFDVTFDPGDDSLSINFLSQLLVNASVDAIPEPTTIGLMALFTPCLTLRGGRKR